ncbi:PQQ-binding-like beta-propeller repeat protein [Candidatus Uabimicrobium sp. HlEnr_7]|uniref:PQQ-binding-like beta-propeller repeat protein n=1 Tax=Candidatus Uabimicrobium helgolandensis TaxID=3095367 RepID=UPI0035575813
MLKILIQVMLTFHFLCLGSCSFSQEVERSAMYLGGNNRLGVFPASQRIIVVPGYGKIHALNADTGKVLWTRKLGWGNSSPAVIYRDMIFVSNESEYHFALNLKTGHILWKFKSGGNAYASERGPIIADDVAYLVAAGDDKVYALDAFSGKKIWQAQVSGTPQNSPVIYKDNVLLCTSAGDFVSLDRKTGNQVWSNKLGKGRDLNYHVISNLSGQSLVLQDKVFTTYRRKLFCVDGSSGKIVWSFTKNNGIHFIAESQGIICLIVEKINGQELIALESQTGKILWQKQRIGKTYPHRIILHNKVIYFNDSLKNKYIIRGLELKSGKELFEIPMQGEFFSMAIANNHIYIHSQWRDNDYNNQILIEALDFKTKSKQWEIKDIGIREIIVTEIE